MCSLNKRLDDILLRNIQLQGALWFEPKFSFVMKLSQSQTVQTVFKVSYFSPQTWTRKLGLMVCNRYFLSLLLPPATPLWLPWYRQPQNEFSRIIGESRVSATIHSTFLCSFFFFSVPKATKILSPNQEVK